MLVGAPKEIKKAERRVGLTPASVRELVAHGHEVLVEATAGDGIGASDEMYVAAGARVAGTAAEVWDQADLIVKVKEPQAVERAQLSDDQVLFTYLHLAPDPEQTRDLVDSGATCIAYETVTDRKVVCRCSPPCRRSQVACRYRPEPIAWRPPAAVPGCCSEVSRVYIRRRSL